MESRGRRRARPISLRQLALVCAAVAFVSGFAAISHAAFPGGSFLFVYIPVIAGLGYREGYAPGLLAAGVSIVSAWYLALPREVSSGTLAHAASLVIFGVVAAAMAVAGARLRALALDNARLHEAERAARGAAERSVGRLARLHNVTAAFSGAMTQDQVAVAIVDQGVAAVGAEAGLVCVLTDDGASVEVIRSTGYPDEFIDRWKRFPLTTPTGITDAIRTGQPVVRESEVDVAGRDPHVGEIPASLQNGTRAAIPLMMGHRAMGAIYLNFREPRKISTEDLDLMRALAREGAQALERARLYERERKVAETLQRAFLPAGFPKLPGLRIHALYVPGTLQTEVSGDWYDVFKLPDGQLAVSVGDVVGHGLEAAVVMGQVRQTIRAAALDRRSPSAVLHTASKVLRLAFEQESMATAIFGLFDPVTAAFTYATAGHPGPVLASGTDSVEAHPPTGLPLGFQETPAGERGIVLPAGGLLVLYTDGLIESTRNVLEGESNLLLAVRATFETTSDDPAATIFQRMIPNGRPADDVAIIALSLAAVPADQFDRVLPAVPSSCRELRQAVRSLASALKLDPARVDTIELAVGEAVNNVIEHAYPGRAGPVQCRVFLNAQTLVVEIEDEGQWRQERSEGRGRGIHVMRALASAVTISKTPRGTVVRLTFGP